MSESTKEPEANTRIPGFPPPWTWAAMEQFMLLLAGNPASEAMVSHLIEATRLQAPFMTPDLIRRELAMTVAALVDPSFPQEVQTMD